MFMIRRINHILSHIEICSPDSNILFHPKKFFILKKKIFFNFFFGIYVEVEKNKSYIVTYKDLFFSTSTHIPKKNFFSEPHFFLFKQ